MKDKAFARGVRREDLVLGAQELGLPIEEHIAFCIEAMRGVADAWDWNARPGRTGRAIGTAGSFCRELAVPRS